MKNKVLVPINFSKASIDTIEFAINVGRSSRLHIELIPYIDDNTPTWVKNAYETKGELVYCFDKFLKSIRNSSVLQNCDWTEVNINLIPKKSLQSYHADQSDVLMVICTSRTINKDSCAAKFAAHIDCPIIFVDSNEKRKSLENVLFVGDYSTANSEFVSCWIDFAKALYSRVHFIFGTLENKIPESKKKIFEKLFQGKPDISFDMTFYESENLASHVKSYIDTYNIDLTIFENENVGVKTQEQMKG